jgi:hypothetical protein
MELSGGALSLGTTFQVGIWSFTPRTVWAKHHLMFESSSGYSGGLWADDVLDAAFADFANELLPDRI